MCLTTAHTGLLGDNTQITGAPIPVADKVFFIVGKHSDRLSGDAVRKPVRGTSCRVDCLFKRTGSSSLEDMPNAGNHGGSGDQTQYCYTAEVEYYSRGHACKQSRGDPELCLMVRFGRFVNKVVEQFFAWAGVGCQVLMVVP